MRIIEIFEVGGSGRGHGHGDNCGSTNYGRYDSNCSCSTRYEQCNYRSSSYCSGSSYGSGRSYSSGRGMGGY